MKRGQNGFTVVETLLVLILFAIIGFTGYYVYHSQKNSNSSYNSAASSANSTVSSLPKASSSGKFVFKEFGVEFDLPSGLKGLSYNVQHFTDGDGIYLTLPAFKEVNDKCYGKTDGESAAGPSFAAISKGSGTFDQSQAVEAGLLKQFSGYYISISYPNGITIGCKSDPNDDSVQAAAHKYQQAFVYAFQATATEVK